MTPQRILIADDDADTVESLCMLLRLGHHEVRGALDGAAALQAAEEFTPDVALLDIGMPKINGYDVARRLRQRWGAKIALVAVTGWGQEEDRRRAGEAGFDALLVKPVTPEALDQVLANLRNPPSAAS